MQRYNATVIAPCRNEINYIDSFIESLQKQTVFETTEFIIADGLSDDGTKEKLLSYSSVFNNIIVVDNPKKIVSTGLNLAVAEAKNKIIIRMDIHSEYDISYIQNSINCLLSKDAQCVGGPWIAKSENSKQRAIAASFQSKWVVGGAKSRDLNYSGEVDTVYLGCWWKDYLLKIGGFDENLVRNQDDELCMRIRLDGKKIFQDPSIKSFYYPRSNFRDLFKQYMQYGFWKVFIIKKYGKAPSYRHIALILFFNIQLISLILSPYSNFMMYFSIASLMSYFLFISMVSISISFKVYKTRFYYLITSIFFMHFSYLIGMLYGIILSLKSKEKLTKSMNKLSR